MKSQYHFFKIYLLFLVIGSKACAQNLDSLMTNTPVATKFKEYTIFKDRDTITFFMYNPDDKPRKHLLLYLEGTGYDPLFSIENINGKWHQWQWGSLKDIKSLPDASDYAFIRILKGGCPKVINESDTLRSKGPSKKYLQKNSLDYRVWQADNVINYCYKKILKNPRKIIVYGHSEGAPVAAKLGTVNKRITHLGFWAGNALPDFFEFALMRRKESFKGEITDSIAQQKIDTLFNDYKEIFKRPNSTELNGNSKVYTFKRWSSYAEPPINHLLQIKIPLYVQVASRDDNAPVETTYMIPLEFARKGKKNLTYKTCVGCDHSFRITQPNGDKISYWNSIFTDFIKWTDIPLK